MAGDASRRNGRLGGKPKGYKHAKTIEKELERERLRQLVVAHLEPMTLAQIAHATGVSYMVLRNPDGTFTRATDEKQIDAACASGAESFRIFTQAPNPASYKDLMDRALDKPKEQVEVTGKDAGPLEIVIRKPWGKGEKP
jgi:hypothetical protein